METGGDGNSIGWAGLRLRGALDTKYLWGPITRTARWFSGWTSDLRLAVEGSSPGHDTAWLFFSETGDRLWRVNCLRNCNHYLGQLSLASLNRVPVSAGVKAGKSPQSGGR